MNKFIIAENETVREALIRLEGETYTCDNPKLLTDTELILNILVQLVNDAAEDRSHTHSIR
jgi:hypothetical protein